jgi:acyl-CoA dehydrogenase
MWAMMAKAAQDKLAAGGDGKADYLSNKLVLARFYMERIMPETALRLHRIQIGADTVMELPAEAF